MDFIDLKTQYKALRETIDSRIQKVLDHGQYILGPEVPELEERLAAYTGARHCITVASGTEALLIALMALDIKPGDEVITTPFTFVATAEMIVLLGARPVFVDVQADTCNIDAARIEAAITPAGRRRSCRWPVRPDRRHGRDQLRSPRGTGCRSSRTRRRASARRTEAARAAICRRSAARASFRPSRSAAMATAARFSANDDALATAMREIRVHGQSGRYRHTRIGVGGRMDTIQCAVVLGKLERFEWEIERRRAIGERYAQRLRSLEPALRVLPVRADRTSVHAQYTVCLPQRDAVQAALKQRGIPTAVHYPLSLHQQPAYAAAHAGESYPVSERLATEVLSLPMHADLDETTQDLIVDAVASALTVRAYA